MKATIIGGGIIGLSCAHYLLNEGWDITILDQSALNDNCSFGNMGFLSPSHFVPLAQPGIVSQGLLWMFDSKSPFYIRPELNWRLADWGIRFLKACNAKNVQKNVRPMLDLLLLSKQLTSEWRQLDGMNFEYAEKGCINYFQTEKYEKAELENVKMGRDLGLNIQVLSKEETHQIEPDLMPNVRGGAWYKDDAHLFPNALMPQLIQLLEKRGAQIIRHSKVTGFQKTNGKINALAFQQGDSTEPQILQSDLFVLAAGSWSAPLASLAGEHLPLVPGKGYSMTFDTPNTLLRNPCILLEAKVAITPWKNRLRIGSTMEIGAINQQILMPRVKGILEAVPRFLPAFSSHTEFNQLANDPGLKQKVWFGFRPLSSDGVPYIGFAKHSSNLLLATGHAMLGLSFAAGTGKLVSEMASGKPTSMNVDAFRPDR